jgi:hypothetical protein
MTREQLNETLKSEFAKTKGLSDEHKKIVEQNAKRLHAVLEQRKPINSKYITTEFSRHKITLLKNYTIVINELNEEQSKSLFEKICQLT